VLVVAGTAVVVGAAVLVVAGTAVVVGAAVLVVAGTAVVVGAAISEPPPHPETTNRAAKNIPRRVMA
jgi:hypothetical protein